MAVKKSELYSSIWQSCDELRGDIDAQIAALEAKLVKARQVTQGMMQEFLTGRTRLV